MNTQTLETESALATGTPSGRSLAWWGMVLFIATETTFIAVLLGSYFYLRFGYKGAWPPPPADLPDLGRAAVMTVLLVPTVITMVLAERALRRDRQGQGASWLAATVALGSLYLLVQWVEIADTLPGLTPTTNVYGSLYYLIHGIDALHVLVGVLITMGLLGAALRDTYGPRHHEHVAVTRLYWYFVIATWLSVLVTLYLVPRI